MPDDVHEMRRFRLVRERDTKNAVLFVDPNPDSDVRNIYLTKRLVEELGDPSAISLTVMEAS